MGYLKDTMVGVSWMGALRGSTRIIAFIRIAILARILTPMQFGLFGIASLALSFLEIVTETGINIFFIQKEGELKDYLDTAWIVSIVRGVFVSLLIILSTPMIAIFFNEYDSKPLLYLIAVVPIVRGFINPAIVKFQKDLTFSKEFVMRFLIFTSEALVAIVISLITRSAVGMVWGLLAGVTVEMLYSLLFIKPTPKFKLNLTQLKRVVNRGKWVTGAVVFDFLYRETDDIAVGKLLNTSALGVYQVAYRMSTLPLTEITNSTSIVTFPVFSKISHDPTRLIRAFIKVIFATAILVIPFGLMLYMFAEPFVLIVVGNKWLEAVPVIRILAVVGIVGALVKSTFPLFLAVKHQEYVTVVTLTGVVGLLISIVPLVTQYGILGAAYSSVLGSLLTVPINLYFLFKLLKQLKEQ